MPEHNGKNIEKLSKAFVDSWDMDTLIEFAGDVLHKAYFNDVDVFQRDWKTAIEQGVIEDDNAAEGRVENIFDE